MSDEVGHLERMQAALNLRGASWACPVCRQENWGMLRGGDVDPTFTVMAKFSDTGQRAYVLTCLNCGFLRWHLTEVMFGTDREKEIS